MLIPSVSSSSEELADWLELRALRSADRNSSIQDLVRALRRSGTADALDINDDAEEDDYASDPRSEKAQAKAEEAFSEVEDRHAVCALVSGSSVYPFEVNDGYLELRSSEDAHVYLFLLLLSVFGKDAGPTDAKGEALFEDVCAEALRSYFGGDPDARATVFGFPRRLLPSGFRDAVDALCQQIGEGGGCRDRPRRKDQKDAKLDIVAWRDFADKRHGKLIGFGQCATGTHWRDKATELMPQQFCQMWLTDFPTVDPVRAFFIPFRLEQPLWFETCIKAGLVFDRCRIVGCSQNPPDDIARRCEEWANHVLCSL